MIAVAQRPTSRRVRSGIEQGRKGREEKNISLPLLINEQNNFMALIYLTANRFTPGQGPQRERISRNIEVCIALAFRGTPRGGLLHRLTSHPAREIELYYDRLGHIISFFSSYCRLLRPDIRRHAPAVPRASGPGKGLRRHQLLQITGRKMLKPSDRVDLHHDWCTATRMRVAGRLIKYTATMSI